MDAPALIPDTLTALIALRAELQRKLHDNLRDIPVSPDLDVWIDRISAIIAAMSARDATHDLWSRDRGAKAIFIEGYNAMRRQCHLRDDGELAWMESISRQSLLPR